MIKANCRECKCKIPQTNYAYAFCDKCIGEGKTKIWRDK